MINRTSLMIVREMQALNYKDSDIPLHDINRKNKDGVTVLFLAACHNHVYLVDLLLKAGADVNTANRDGVTAFFMAAEKGHLNVVKLLINHGADVSRGHSNGNWTPIKVARENKHYEIVYCIKAKLQGTVLSKALIEYAELADFKKTFDDNVILVQKNKRGIFAGQLPRDLREVKNIIAKIENEQYSLYNGMQFIIDTISKSGGYKEILAAAKACQSRMNSVPRLLQKP